MMVFGFLLVVFVVAFWCLSNCSSLFAQACFIFLCINEMFVVGGFGMNLSLCFSVLPLATDCFALIILAY